MGRIFILMAAVSIAALTAAEAKEIRQVAPGITMAPGLPSSVQAKKSEPAPAPVQTSKTEPATYGVPVTPALPVAEVQPPQPSKPAVNVTVVAPETKSAPAPAPAPVQEVSQPKPVQDVAQPKPQLASAPVEQPKSQQKVVRAPREREIRVGDRIPDDVRLDPIRVRVGDRIPDNVQLYSLPRTAVR